jgi:hypothetical protein
MVLTVQALDFNTIEALIPHLQPSSEGSGCAQILEQHNGWPQPQLRNGDIWCGYPSLAWRGTVQQERYN